MFYKCDDCGHVFESGEEKKIIETFGFKNPPYKEESACPFCKSFNFSQYEPHSCNECGKEGEDFLYDLCDECLEEKINYENAFDFLVGEDCLVYFIFKFIYKMECPKVYTKEFEEEMKMVFLRRKVDDLATGKSDFLKLLVSFIKEDFCCFCEFLKERGEI